MGWVVNEVRDRGHHALCREHVQRRFLLRHGSRWLQMVREESMLDGFLRPAVQTVDVAVAIPQTLVGPAPEEVAYGSELPPANGY